MARKNTAHKKYFLRHIWLYVLDLYGIIYNLTIAVYTLYNLLDEQLDECSIDMIQSERKYIKPLTMCKAVITNSPEAKYNQTMFKAI